MVVASFERSEMVANIDFRDVRANEPLPKFGFQNVFVTIKNQNLLFSFDLRRRNVRQIYDISTALHTF